MSLLRKIFTTCAMKSRAQKLAFLEAVDRNGVTHVALGGTAVALAALPRSSQSG